MQRVSEVFRGFTIYYTPPPERVWSFRRQPGAALESHRSAFQARRAINELLDGRSPSTPRRDYVPGTAADSPARKTTEPTRTSPPRPTTVPLTPPAKHASPVDLKRLLDGDSIRQLAVTLPRSGRSVLITVVGRREKRFAGTLPANFRTVPNKVAVELDGLALYPEFAIIRRLAQRGWSAAWRKNWQGAAFWSDIGVTARIPDHPLALFTSIQGPTGRGGAWDILAWYGDQTLLIESKEKGTDRLTANQLAWLESAIDKGVPAECFAVYEYRA